MSFSMLLSDCETPLQAVLQGADAQIYGVSIDTRTLKAGDLFIAIKGERFDGHEFLDQAEAAGAAAVLVDHAVKTSLPQLIVEDTVAALGQLGGLWARRFQIPTVAVTGSNGKTTVKEMITSILRQLGPVLSTQGNLNNEIGVPLTLLNMREEHLYAVIEMGANHAGEIARLVNIVKPDVAVITNIGTAHLEGFGSVEGIANAKSEIYGGLDSAGYAVINADDAYVEVMRKAASHCTIRQFGLSAEADVQGVPGPGLNIRSLDKVLSPRFPLTGDHNGLNALAAVAAVQCLDVQAVNIVRGLESVRAVPGRLERKPGINGATLIDDSYNANPDSAEQAVNVLASHDGVRYFVLGDMAELGPNAESLHSRVGAYAKQQGLDGLWTTGPLAAAAFKAFAATAPSNSGKSRPVRNRSVSSSVTMASAAAEAENPAAAGATQIPREGGAGAHFADQEALVADIKRHMTAGVTVLIKGSRSARMERVVKALMPAAKGGKASKEELLS